MAESTKSEFGQSLGKTCSTIPGPCSKELGKKLKAFEAPGITYLSEKFPIFWAKALGSNVEDVDENIYVDFTSAFGVSVLGHRHPSIVKAVQDQLQKLPHGMGDVHPPEIKVELLEKLSQIFPTGNGQSILCSAGAEAVEAALKTAFLKTKKPGVICFQGSYHGLTYGALAVSGQPRFWEPFAPQVSSFGYRVEFPDHSLSTLNPSFQELENLLQKAEKDQCPIGAVLVEPIQGRAGVRIPPKGWLKRLSEFTKKHDILLIVDEIMTGFGRCGTWFAVNQEDVVPDLLCVGKALTGIFPFSACMGTEEAMSAWPKSSGEALHTSTFLGHPLSCAAALASIEEIEKENLGKRATMLGEKLQTELQSFRASTPLIRDIRGRGMMIGIELCKEKHTGLAFEASVSALAQGLILLPSGESGNVISITPPLTITEEQLEWGLHVLKKVITSLS